MDDIKFDKQLANLSSEKSEDLEFKQTDARDSLYSGIINSIFIEGVAREELADQYKITVNEIKELEKKALRALYTGSVKHPKSVKKAEDTSLDKAKLDPKFILAT